MALSHETPARPGSRRGKRSAWTLAPLALVCALGAGCGGGAADLPAASTAVAGETYSSVVSKPAFTADLASPATVGAPPSTVPVVTGKVQYGVPVGASSGVGASLRGAVPFPAQDAWNVDVSRAATDPDSATLVAAIGAQAPLRIGFGGSAGVPYAVVDATQPTVPVRIAGGAPRAWPIPPALQASTDGGRLSVVDRDAGLLYELRGAVRAADGGWDASAGAAWRLDAADAAPFDGAGAPDGLPAFPGLVRADEASAGAIRHALRVTVPALRAAWRSPAHATAAGAGAADDAALPPLGLRLRLKPGFEIPADASPQARAILAALKAHGAIVSGIGPALTLEGAPDPSWDTARLAADLARVRVDDFEAVSQDGPARP
jgi:hypothetical protein